MKLVKTPVQPIKVSCKQPAFTCLKSTMEASENFIKSVQK